MKLTLEQIKRAEHDEFMQSKTWPLNEAIRLTEDIAEINVHAATGTGTKTNCTKEDLLSVLDSLEGETIAIDITVLAGTGNQF